MKTFLELGSTPADESCAQVGQPDYPERSRAECAVYANQIRRAHPLPEDIGCYITVKSFPHDFGTYREVCVVYDDEEAEAVGYAFKLEGNLPDRWDAEAKTELAQRGFPVKSAREARQ